MEEYRNYRTLTEEELQEMERLYPVTPNRLLARQYGISVDSLQDYVAKPRGWKKDRKSVFIGNRGGHSLTEKEVAWIVKHYQHTKNEDIMQKFQIGESQLHRVARKYGLKKSRQQTNKNQRNASEAAQVVCKRYGIYEETARRMKEKMADMLSRGERIPGSFAPGVTNLMRLGAKRYAKVVEKSRQTRNETIRKERIRLHWGLPQKSKMHLTFDGYDEHHRKKAIHRHLFRRHNYIVERGSDDIYYDEETERRPQMEANAPKYGLRVMQA